MNYLVITFACVFGAASAAQFFSVDRAVADIFDGETTASALNVRTGPGVSHSIKTAVPHGTPVAIFEVRNGWARIAADTGPRLVSGWVSGKYVEIYEVALPQVASAGFEDVTKDEIDALSQVVIATLEDAKLGRMRAEDAPAPIADLELSQAKLDVGDTKRAVEVIVRLDDASDIAVMERALNKLISKMESGAEPDAQVNNQPPEITGPLAETTPQVNQSPLAFEALNLSCRSSYFSGVLETCTSDIRVDVSVPEAVASLVDKRLSLKCDVDYSFEAEGERQTETTSDFVEVILDKGQGSAVLNSRVNFLYRADDVTSVEVDDVTCGAAAAN